MAGLYVDRILPWFINLVMDNKDTARWRRHVVPRASGRVVEIGFGSGLNLPFYGDQVSSLTAVDPSAGLHAIAAERIARLRFPFTFVNGSAETLPCDGDEFDSAVVTWSLCSIPRAEAALGEVRRVLKPSGTLYFVEHGRAPEAAVARWQDRLNGPWRRFSGGCNMNRPMDTVIGDAGFSIEGLESGYLLKGPRVLTYTYLGAARPR